MPNIGDKLKGKYWSGENYGWQSKATHDKLKQEGKFRAGTQEIDRVVSSGMQWATQNVPGVVNAVSSGLKTVGGAVGFAAQKLEESSPVGEAIVKGTKGALDLYDQGVEFVSEKTNIDKRLVGLAGDVAIGAATGGAAKAAQLTAKTAIPLAQQSQRLQKAAKAGKWIPEMEAPLTLRQAAENAGVPFVKAQDRNIGAASRLQMQRSPWAQKLIQGTIEPADLDTAAVQSLDPKYMTWSPLELINEGGQIRLRQAARKERQMLELYSSAKFGDTVAQRKLYDIAGRPLDADDPSPILYGRSYSSRKKLFDALGVDEKDWKGKQLHHDFGNKDAAETMLAQGLGTDPVVQINLSAHQKKIGLEGGRGIDNMVLSEILPHNQFHQFIKDLGLEGKAGKNADVALGDLANATGVGVNDLFEMLTTYAERTKPFFHKKYKEFGGMTPLKDLRKA